jgi:hypothetical protein
MPKLAKDVFLNYIRKTLMFGTQGYSINLSDDGRRGEMTMKKMVSFTVCIFLAAGGTLLSQTKPEGQKAYEHIKYLASEEM